MGIYSFGGETDANRGFTGLDDKLTQIEDLPFFQDPAEAGTRT
jgi:hypothetical protein